MGNLVDATNGNYSRRFEEVSKNFETRTEHFQFLHGRLLHVDTAFMELGETVENAKHHVETMSNRVFHMRSPGLTQPADEPQVYRPAMPEAPAQPTAQPEPQATTEAPPFQVPAITATVAVPREP